LTGILALRVDDGILLRGSLVLILIGAGLLAIRDVQILSLFGLIGLGFGQAAIFPIFMSQTPRRVGLNHSSNAIGFQVGVAGFGAAILPGLFAWSTKFFGLEALSVGILLNSILLLLIIARVVRLYAVKAA
jgi:fucose permease